MASTQEISKPIFLVMGPKEKPAPIGIDNVTLFIAWLDYVRMYLNSADCDFNFGSFVKFILAVMLMPSLKANFESKALENVLGIFLVGTLQRMRETCGSGSLKTLGNLRQGDNAGHFF